jgi:hypothetical protein
MSVAVQMPPEPNLGDEESDELILKLQLEEIESLQQGSKGKGKLGEVSDPDLAFLEYRKELERRLLILQDRRMVQSIANAVQADGTTIHEIQLQEQQCNSDHQIAARLSGSRPSSVISISKSSLELDQDLVERLAAVNISVPLERTSEPESAAVGSLRNSRICAVCSERKPSYKIVKLPCKDEYCNICTVELFRSALTDESLFPPRCCRQTIDLISVIPFLNADLITQYEEKSIEFSTPNRIYCHSPACSAFIFPSNIPAGADDVACTTCGLRTCLICKRESHEGDICPGDETAQQVQELAAANGWQRCYSCNRLVELEIGCNHIT